MAKAPLSTAEVAELIGKSIKTVHRMAHAGLIPGAVKLAGRTGPFIFDPDMIEYFIAQQKRAKAS